MRVSFRSIPSFALACIGLIDAFRAFARACFDRIVLVIREAFLPAEPFIPRLADVPLPVRRILMSATSLSGRQVGGVRIKGFLGRPTVRMLTG